MSAAEARVAASEFADTLHPPLAVRTLQNLTLVVSELAANALRHAGAVRELRLSAAANTLRVAIDDPSDTPPQGRAPDWNGARGGFGWMMIQRLADSLAVTRRPGGGKTVLVTLAR
ncbi:ATP-binding protein [Streptomyces sp. NPDC008139]|uniref:ATP-binding protein n=1 Tax=Streptomyces sp. NPDC008139 TaxID=3364814 RepID=UPI0036E28C6A